MPTYLFTGIMNEKGSIYIVNYLKGLTSYVEVEHVLTVNIPRHKAITGLENQFSVFLRVTVLHRFYCTFVSYNHHIIDSRCQFNVLC